MNIIEFMFFIVNFLDVLLILVLLEFYFMIVEWKFFYNNSIISIDEYVIGMEKLSSICII